MSDPDACRKGSHDELALASPRLPPARKQPGPRRHFTVFSVARSAQPTSSSAATPCCSKPGGGARSVAPSAFDRQRAERYRRPAVLSVCRDDAPFRLPHVADPGRANRWYRRRETDPFGGLKLIHPAEPRGLAATAASGLSQEGASERIKCMCFGTRFSCKGCQFATLRGSPSASSAC